MNEIIESREPESLLPTLLLRANSNARFAWEEFIFGTIKNEHTRRAYRRAVGELFSVAEKYGLSLQEITPKFIRTFIDALPGSVPTKKLKLSAIRHFFDIAVMRHAIALNPASSVRAERYSVKEGKTPEISIEQVRQLFLTCEDSVLGDRDRAVIGTLAFTAARVGAVVKLAVKDFVWLEEEWQLRFHEKGGKVREIPVRIDLVSMLKTYLSKFPHDPAAPLFQSARHGKMTGRGMRASDVRRMIKVRLRKAGLPEIFSPHSFRVCTITDLLKQNVSIEDVQNLAGHSDPRTTRLYDRRGRVVTRNIIERISV